MHSGAGCVCLCVCVSVLLLLLLLPGLSPTLDRSASLTHTLALAPMDALPTGFPLAMHMTLYQDTLYWRNPWTAGSSKHSALPPLRSLFGFLCGSSSGGMRRNVARTFAKRRDGPAVVADAVKRQGRGRMHDATGAVAPSASSALLGSTGACMCDEYSCIVHASCVIHNHVSCIMRLWFVQRHLGTAARSTKSQGFLTV
jgi:hypothetical protein